MSFTCPVSLRLKEARTMKKLTQQQLGMLLGLDPNNGSARINQYERGKHEPDYDTLKRIAGLLDLPVSYFYCEDDFEAKILKAMHLLNSEQKETLLNFIETFNR